MISAGACRQCLAQTCLGVRRRRQGSVLAPRQSSADVSGRMRGSRVSAFLLLAVLLAGCPSAPTAAPAPRPFPTRLAAGTVSTYAGSGRVGDLGGGYADGPALSALFRRPTGLAMHAAGNLCVADQKNQRIRMISAEGQVVTVAGSGPAGPLMGGYLDGPASSSRFADPVGLCVAADGSIYAADYLNHCIRLVTPNGYVRTLAGIPGLQGYQDGPAASALFSYPMDVLISESMQVLCVADMGNHRIRIVALP